MAFASPHLEERSDDEEVATFPRLGGRSAPTALPPGEVRLQIQQRRAEEGPAAYEVHRSGNDGSLEIPLSVCATTVSSSLHEDVLRRSPWLTCCLESPSGTALSRSLARSEEEEFEDAFGPADPSAPSQFSLLCRHSDPRTLELVLPSRGVGQGLLTPGTLLQCLDSCLLAAASPAPVEPTGMYVFTMFLWAWLLKLEELFKACRQRVLDAVGLESVALVLALGHATSDDELLRKSYWYIREAMCHASGVPKEWINGPGAVRLSRGGLLSYKSICQTHLRVMSKVFLADVAAKESRWLSATDCYTLCQLHRRRHESGGYPHTYELRLDHTNEVLLTALREDELSACRIFAHSGASSDASDHCKDFIGTVVANFWGTQFTLYDSGSDVESLTREPLVRQLPLKPRSPICTISYETNIFGDCPRKIGVDFIRQSERPRLENLGPRWDKKLNSYALPFFGRVKKASAKNFQLVVNNDANTIFLMFGKVAKDLFCLDFRGPIAPLEAMAIASAALAKKRAVS